MDISRLLDSRAYIRKYPWLFRLALGMSALSCFLIIWGIFDTSRYWYLLYLLLLNLAILSPFLLRTQKYQEAISRKHELLEGYARLLELIAANTFTKKAHLTKNN